MNNKINNIIDKNIYKNNYKSGISLIVLILTIVVALILTATVIISTTTALDNAHVTTFAKNLTEIQEAAESYYLSNNVMPSYAGSTITSRNDLTAISRNQSVLLQELTENEDLDAQFYELDLDKINVTKVAYGNRELGTDDIFVIAYPSMNVYYPYGIEAKGKIYFSITSKISNVTKISQTQIDASATTIISSGGIKVTKNNGWANKMGVSIDAQMASGEVLYMSVSGDTNRIITTVTGANTFGFNLLSSIVSNTETIKVPTLTATEVGYIEAGTKPLADRYVDILKYNGTEVVGKVRIDLSNFSSTGSTLTTATLSSYPTLNAVALTLASSQSGIKEVRYEYLKKFADDGTIVDYYSGFSNFDSAYMQSKSKKSRIVNGLTSTINAPKNVQSIKIAVIDNAGNINLYDQQVAPSLYIGYSIDSATTNAVQLTAKVFSGNGVKSITFSKSVDGITFTDNQVYTLNTTNNGVTNKQSLPYTNMTSNVSYVKIIAVNYNNTITETRTVSVNINNVVSDLAVPNKPVLATGMTALRWDGSVWQTVANPNDDTTWYDYAGKQWANAKTADGSMWVWIPRYVYKISNLWHSASTLAGTINIQFSKGTVDSWNSEVIGSLNTATGASASNNTWTNHPGFTFGSTEVTGIWVAKFTASNITAAVNSVPGGTAFRSITVSNAFTECRNMETNIRYGWDATGTGIDTHLIKNVEWGAVAYLSKSIYGIRDTEVSVNTSTTITGGGGAMLYVTYAGMSTTGNSSGVYDMSGNVYEYTAAYINGGNTNLATYGLNLVNADVKYKDIYTITTDTQTNNYTNAANKKGDAIYETSGSYSGSNSWFKDYSTMPNGASPFFAMGGLGSSGTNAGCFSFYMYTGELSTSYGFRPTLIVNNEL